MKVINPKSGPRNFMKDMGYTYYSGNPLRKLDEVTLNRIISKHDKSGYCIVSACRATFYTDGTPVPNDVDVGSIPPEKLADEKQVIIFNNARTKELRQKIISANRSFLPVFGGFKEENAETSSFEKSFIVFNFDRKGNLSDMDSLYQDCLNWGKEYNQDAILVKKPDGKPYYASCVKGSEGNVDMEFSGEYTLNDITQMYFTALKKINDTNFKGKPQRFTFEGVYLNPYPVSTAEMAYRVHTNEIL